MLNCGVQHNTLSINHSENGRLYKTTLHHNCYPSVFTTSLKSKLPDETHRQSDLFLQKSDIHVSLPHPISKAFQWTVSEDVCFELVHRKAEYIKKLDLCKQFYKKDRNKVTSQSLKSFKKGDVLALPQYLIDLILNGDQYPYFEAEYDYFYAGGNLSEITIKNVPFLIYNNCNNIVFQNFKTEEIISTNYHLDAPICSIKNLKASPFVLFRDRKKIDIVSVNMKKDTANLKSIFSTTNADVPITDGIMMNAINFAYADVAYKTRICEVHTGKQLYEKKFELENDMKGDLCQLESCDNEHCLVFMSRCDVSLLDKRINPKEEIKSKIMRTGYFACNQLCCLCLSSVDPNYVYIASKHSVFKLDLREMEIVKKWAHMMENSPICIKSYKFDTEELVFISSFSEIICLEVSEMNHLPFKVKDIKTTYEEYKIHKRFLLRNELEKRFSLSTTGLEFIDGYLFSSNSIGDVFKYGVTRSNDVNNLILHRETEEKLQDFIDKVPPEIKQLEFTHLQDMSALKHIISEETDASALKIFHGPNRRLQKYLKPLAKFGQYDMATIWESPTTVMDNEDIQEHQKSRIDSWLEQSKLNGFEYDPLEDS